MSRTELFRSFLAIFVLFLVSGDALAQSDHLWRRPRPNKLLELPRR